MKPHHKRLLSKTIVVLTAASSLLVIPVALFGRDERVVFGFLAYIVIVGLPLTFVLRHRCRSCGERMLPMDAPTPRLMERLRYPSLSDFDSCPACGNDPFGDPAP